MKKSHGTLNGFLDQGCTIKGEVVFADLLRVHGHVIGTVSSEHELLVGEGGVVEGEVVVGRLVVAGTVQGTVRVKERVVIHGTGQGPRRGFRSDAGGRRGRRGGRSGPHDATGQERNGSLLTPDSEPSSVAPW